VGEMAEVEMEAETVEATVEAGKVQRRRLAA
jgi:hypothetical protein